MPGKISAGRGWKRRKIRAKFGPDPPSVGGPSVSRQDPRRTTMWKLSIEDDQGNKTVVNLVRDEYSVGRAEENTVRLTERNISRRHAKLKRNGVGWLLEDMASYNGCFVNGVRVAEPQRLEHGDLVQLGDYRLEILD